MTSRRRTLLAGLLMVGLASAAAARPGNAPLPERSGQALQRLIDRARPGDTIQIPPGVYQGAIVVKKDVVLVGAGTKRTILDGMGADVVLSVESAARISRIAVRNGKIGVQFMGPSATMQDSVISGNSVYGVHCLANPILFNNRIHENGTGVAVNSRSPILLHNTVARNREAGIWSWYAPGPVLIHNLVASNKMALDSGAGSTPELLRSYEWDNARPSPGFLLEDPGLEDASLADSLTLSEASPLAEAVERSELLRAKAEARPDALYPPGFLGKRRGEVELDRANLATYVRRYEPKVVYRLTPEPGVFQVEISFATPPFQLGSSKSTKRINVLRVWDSKDGIRLHADVQAQEGATMSVQVDSYEPDPPRESGRYHLLCEFEDLGTWRAGTNGKMIFQRMTSLENVEIVPPEGWELRRLPARQTKEGRLIRAEITPPGAAAQ